MITNEEYPPAVQPACFADGLTVAKSAESVFIRFVQSMPGLSEPLRTVVDVVVPPSVAIELATMILSHFKGREPKGANADE